jgi:hypothetical protein
VSERGELSHQLLRTLDGQGRLLRVYTQNIDGLEEKTGLKAGLPQKPPSKGKKPAPAWEGGVGKGEAGW